MRVTNSWTLSASRQAGSQLERKRDTVQPSRDLRDRTRVLVIQNKAMMCCRCSVQEQTHGRTALDVNKRRGRSRIRRCQWRQRPADLPQNTDRLAAGGQNLK